jgi:hypothetical protein
LPALENDFKAGKLRQGRHSLEKMLTAIGPESYAMLIGVLGLDVPFGPTADLLAGSVTTPRATRARRR